MRGEAKCPARPGDGRARRLGRRSPARDCGPPWCRRANDGDRGVDCRRQTIIAAAVDSHRAFPSWSPSSRRRSCASVCSAFRLPSSVASGYRSAPGRSGCGISRARSEWSRSPDRSCRYGAHGRGGAWIDRHGDRRKARRSRHRGRMRRRLCVRDLPCLCRRSLAREDRRAGAEEEDMLDFGFDVRANSGCRARSR